MSLENPEVTQEELEKLKSQIKIILRENKPITSEPKVKILADSITRDRKRLTTFELTFWRPILPEITRHRALSFSVRSSRATPVDTLIGEIRNSPWGPTEWGENEKGMVANKVFTNEQYVDTLNYIWYQSASLQCKMAKTLADAGVHKQIVNRLLEPFSCTHAVVSGTEWDNFYKLRTAKDAQPEMRQLALAMQKSYEESTPVQLSSDDWHLPYITHEESLKYDVKDLCKISAARCARVSYKLYDGSTNPDKDSELYQKLVTKFHFSPLEHVATPAGSNYLLSNFKGWNQLRKFVEE